MIVVKVIGGLGNQMFQYAYGRALSIAYRTELFLDISIYLNNQSNRSFDLDMFDLPDVQIGDSKDLDLSQWQYVITLNDFDFCYNKNPLSGIKNLRQLFRQHKVIVVLEGYWQSERYFKNIKSILQSDFKMLLTLNEKSNLLYHKIINSQSVMINVRRGDYLSLLDYHGIVDVNYVDAAISQVLKKAHTPVFYVFSDDIPWCRENLSHIPDVFFVDESYYTPNYDQYFFLMQACKYFILANSSFSWWSAWLSNREGKHVIAPKRWFANTGINTIDLIPKSWRKI